MFVVPVSWELTGLLLKLLLYAGGAGLTGATVSIACYSDGSRRSLSFLLAYGLVAAALGFHAALFAFLVQVGMMSGSGLPGMFDWDMMSLLLDTPPADSTVWRLSGFVLALITLPAAWLQIQKRNAAPGPLFYRVLVTLLALAVLLIANSFRSIGHVSVLSPLAQTAIVLHIIAFGLWVGSLYPLHRQTHADDLPALQAQARRFGNHMMLVVGTLVAAGGLMLLELLHSPMELFTSVYGLFLSAKFLLVAGLLGLAALNRYRLVPALIEGGDASKLARSIRWEMVVSCLILMFTAYLSTSIGPASH